MGSYGPRIIILSLKVGGPLLALRYGSSQTTIKRGLLQISGGTFQMPPIIFWFLHELPPGHAIFKFLYISPVNLCSIEILKIVDMFTAK
jgi:hypothetical protein